MDTYSSWEIAFSGHACVNFLSKCHLEAPAEHSGASSTAMGTWGVLHTAKGRLIWLEWFLPVIAATLCNMNWGGGQFRKTWSEVLGMSEELPSLQSSDFPVHMCRLSISEISGKIRKYWMWHSWCLKAFFKNRNVFFLPLWEY